MPPLSNLEVVGTCPFDPTGNSRGFLVSRTCCNPCVLQLTWTVILPGDARMEDSPQVFSLAVYLGCRDAMPATHMRLDDVTRYGMALRRVLSAI